MGDMIFYAVIPVLIAVLAVLLVSLVSNRHLRRSRRLLEEAQRAGRLGCWVYDIARRRLEVSGSAAETLAAEWPRRGRIALRKFLDTVVFREDRSALEAFFSGLEHADDGAEMVFRTAADNEADRHLILVRGRREHESKGAGNFLIGFFQDVTDEYRIRASLRESEQEKSFVLKNVGEHIAYFDRDLRVIWSNWGKELIRSADAAELKGMSRCELLCNGNEELCGECVACKALESGVVQEEDVVLEDGRIFRARANPVYNDVGERIGVIESMTDVTERRAAEHNMLQMQFALQQSPVEIYFVDEDGSLVYVNEQVSRRSGYSMEELRRKKIHDIHLDGGPEWRQRLWEELGRRGSKQFEVRHCTASGQVYPVSVAAHLTEVGGRPMVCAVATDISDRIAAEEKLRRHALYDRLTALPNRYHFMRKIKGLLDDGNYRFVVMLFDIDRFKQVNDNLGHSVGDLMLMDVAKRLEESLPQGTFSARMGGDEFAVLIEDTVTEPEARELAQRLLDNISRPMPILKRRLRISVSIGVVMGMPEMKDADDVIRYADLAMYEGKRESRSGGMICFYDDSMRKCEQQRMQLEADLHTALQENQFPVYFQPQLSPDGRRVLGVEALVRWKHPELGYVSPVDFIPVAEESGLIFEVGREVLRMALSVAANWMERMPELKENGFKVSVNVSARQFAFEEFAGEISEVLNLSGMAPEYLVLELTETAIMHDRERALRVIEEVKQLGIRVAIDDFGTGYSSLAYFQQLNVDYLKIDRSFVDGLHQNPMNRSIVAAVLAMSDVSGVQVIAEGVETADELEVLAGMGCQAVQGYYFSRPLPAEAAYHFIAERIRGGNYV